MAEVARAAGPISGPRWWAVGGGLLLVALAAVLICAIVGSSGGRLVDTPAPIIADGASFVAAQGSGRKQDRSFVLESPGPEGVSVLTVQLPPFRASEFTHVEWTIASPLQPPELRFLWRTREHPRRNYTKRLPWLVTGAAPLHLTPEDGWSGTITGVALVVSPGMTTPIRVDALRMASPSVIAATDELASDWSERHRLRGYSVNYPFDAERGHELPALIAVAVAVGLAGALYLVLARWRRWPLDGRALWAIFLAGWLLLDLRWQANLGREALDRGLRFAGKSTEEMHRAADDASLFALMEAMKGALPSTPSRLFLYCDNDFLCARAAFMLYPQNLFRVAYAKRAPVRPEELHAGDHLLLVYSRALGYDRERRLAVWPDGASKPADEILLQREALLLRIR